MEDWYYRVEYINLSYGCKPKHLNESWVYTNNRVVTSA